MAIDKEKLIREALERRGAVSRTTAIAKTLSMFDKAEKARRHQMNLDRLERDLSDYKTEVIQRLTEVSTMAIRELQDAYAVDKQDLHNLRGGELQETIKRGKVLEDAYLNYKNEQHSYVYQLDLWQKTITHGAKPIMPIYRGAKEFCKHTRLPLEEGTAFMTKLDGKYKVLHNQLSNDLDSDIESINSELADRTREINSRSKMETLLVLPYIKEMNNES